MITAVDSSVVLDVIVDDPAFADGSVRLLRRCMAEGKLIVGECVLAEIQPAFGSDVQISAFLEDWQLEFVPSTRASSILAGAHFATFLQRGGRPGRIVADFLIGAHAQLTADRLLARDRGYLRDYFSDLEVLDPTSI